MRMGTYESPRTFRALASIDYHPSVPVTAEQEFYSPGFGAQGGDPARFPGLARHYLIMGRSLLRAEDPAKELARVEERLGMGAGT